MIKIWNDWSYETRHYVGSEMSAEEGSFICGLIKKYNPTKIVEIGVAAGGTSVMMMECINTLPEKSEMFSIDKSEQYYKDPTKKTGFYIDIWKESTNIKVDHTLLTGHYAVEYLKEIGGDIDFLMLDTRHCLPGELLDFLALFPYLSKGAIVVVDDIVFNHYGNFYEHFATQILFDTVVAEKFVAYDKQNKLLNIAAFRINDDTTKYIDSLFSAMLITWKYCPDDKELVLYENVYKEHYSEENLRLFKLAVELNRKTVGKRMVMQQEEANIYGNKKKNVYIYGCGHYGRQLGNIFMAYGSTPKGYIITNGKKKPDDINNVYWLSEINTDVDRDVIYIGVGEALQDEICRELEGKGIRNYVIPNEDLLKLLG